MKQTYKRQQRDSVGITVLEGGCLITAVVLQCGLIRGAWSCCCIWNLTKRMVSPKFPRLFFYVIFHLVRNCKEVSVVMSTPKRLLYFSTLLRVRRSSRRIFHLYSVFFRHVFLQPEPTLDLYEINETTARLIRKIYVHIHIYTRFPVRNPGGDAS